MDVAEGTIVVWSDIACPWAHACVARLHRARAELGLQDAVRLDHRAFPLEVMNERPTPRKVLQAEVPVVGAMEPDAGWEVWQRPESEWPVTTLLALEAVQAAKAQGLAASEALDLALRRAFFAESRCISMRHVILAVADETAGLDAGALADVLDAGEARRTVMDHAAAARGDEVKGSPHAFLPDGTDAHNPGTKMHWEGDHGTGFPVVDDDDPSIYLELLRRATG